MQNMIFLMLYFFIFILYLTEETEEVAAPINIDNKKD
jgi:hypothetical protein